MNILESMDGKPMKQVCIRMNGQMTFICPPFPMYSCGDCLLAYNSLYFSLRQWTMQEIRNVVCLLLFRIFHPSFITNSSVIGKCPQGVAIREESQA